VVFERYPELKANELYIEAQRGQKEYEENVRLSRMVYNDTATKMNRLVRQWPSSIVASMLHFDVKDYLKVDDEKKRSYPDLDEANHWHENVLARMKADRTNFLMEEDEPLCKNKVPREGVVIRIDGDKFARAWKLKTMRHYGKEAEAHDKGEADMEETA
jgi:hypothetical protein